MEEGDFSLGGENKNNKMTDKIIRIDGNDIIEESGEGISDSSWTVELKY